MATHCPSHRQGQNPTELVPSLPQTCYVSRCCAACSLPRAFPIPAESYNTCPDELNSVGLRETAIGEIRQTVWMDGGPKGRASVRPGIVTRPDGQNSRGPVTILRVPSPSFGWCRRMVTGQQLFCPLGRATVPGFTPVFSLGLSSMHTVNRISPKGVLARSI